MTNLLELLDVELLKLFNYIIDNSNYTPEYLEGIDIEKFFKIADLVEQKIIKQNDYLKQRNSE